MTYCPQPDPANPAHRVKVRGSVVVAIRSEGTQPVRAKLHELSTTGGLLVLSKALEQGDVVEVAFQASQGTVRGMAELLSVRCESKSGCLQAFRFVALEDGDDTRLRMTLESLIGQTVIGSRPAKSTWF